MAGFITDLDRVETDAYLRDTATTAEAFLNLARRLMPGAGVGQTLGGLLTAYVNASGLTGNLDEAERGLKLALDTLPQVRQAFASETLARGSVAGRA